MPTAFGMSSQEGKVLRPGIRLRRGSQIDVDVPHAVLRAKDLAVKLEQGVDKVIGSGDGFIVSC